jgi:hypothetical protein
VFLPRLTENPLLLKIFDLKERRFSGDFCFSFLQVGYRPPKKKGQKAPKYTALRQVRTIRVTLKRLDYNTTRLEFKDSIIILYVTAPLKNATSG